MENIPINPYQLPNPHTFYQMTSTDDVKVSSNSFVGIDSTLKELDNKHPFEQITKNMFKTYLAKNHDYGNSFDQSLDKFGLIASVVRMSDKINRLGSLVNKDAAVSESIQDTLLDLANYAIMTVMWMNNDTKNL